MNNIDWTAALSIGFFDEMDEIDKVASWGAVSGGFKNLARSLVSKAGGKHVGHNLKMVDGKLVKGRKMYGGLADDATLGQKGKLMAARAAEWAGHNPRKAIAAAGTATAAGGAAGGGWLAS
jgi:hypothetical protein